MAGDEHEREPMRAGASNEDDQDVTQAQAARIAEDILGEEEPDEEAVKMVDRIMEDS